MEDTANKLLSALKVLEGQIDDTLLYKPSIPKINVSDRSMFKSPSCLKRFRLKTVQDTQLRRACTPLAGRENIIASKFKMTKRPW